MKILTVTGIRPDFIRMSKVFEKLDQNFDHIMVHTGQHYEDSLSKIFFKDLKIRKPDYILNTGTSSSNHYEQLSYLCKELIYLIEKKKINPDLTIFLGDSNTVLASVPLFKEGYKICHIEGGMRSYDRRMPEEVNRVCCDYVSDIIFVYTPLYKKRLIKENKNPENIHVVGNTITEIVNEYMPKGQRQGGYFVADIHRNENLKNKTQYNHILKFLNQLGKETNKIVKLVKFSRALKLLRDNTLLEDKKNIELVGPFGFLEYLKLQYHSDGVISDSGTAQEECPLIGVPVVVPRDFTERPESIDNGNSILIGETNSIENMLSETIEFFNYYEIPTIDKLRWLGEGNTSDRIMEILKNRV